MPDFYEFFAGGGMARAGLGPTWNCLFANDIDPGKSRVYRENWPAGCEIKSTDVATLSSDELPGQAYLAWASFPCQDLSLAGIRSGLLGSRSGAFWPFWKLMNRLVADERAPGLIVLENVCGALTSHQGKDFTAICAAFQQADYSVGALIVDASLFVPQSRARLFIIGVHAGMMIPRELKGESPSVPWHTKAIKAAYGRLPAAAQQAWVWWNLPLPAKRTIMLEDIIEESTTSTAWFTDEAVQKLINMMSDVNRAKVIQAGNEGRRIIGTVYKRTRLGTDGRKAQQAEVRFDGISGCLRTPAGGSSRQVILVVDGQSVKARLISSRETARLMGLPDTYKLPENYNEAYHLTGDGVVVPVVRHLAQYILEPILTLESSY